MPRVFPFRGVRFNVPKIGDLTKVTTQPYDRIGTELQEEYYKRHPNNIIRIVRRKDETGDASGMKKYPLAAQTLADWLKDGTLVQDAKPCLYAYFQTYQTPEGERTRKGFSAVVRIEEPGKGRILPHEQTHTGPKIDRFHLLSNTRTHTEQVFFLYSDPDRVVNRILDEAARGRPELEAKDDSGERHRVWKIEDPRKIEAIQKFLDSKEVIIADGHHRYETSWNYRQEMTKQKAKCEGNETYENVLATLVNMDDEGLTIFGTHRLCRDIAGFDPDKLLTAARKSFDVREYPFENDAEEKFARSELLEDLNIEGLSRPCFGVAAKGAKAHYLFLVRDKKAAAALVKDKRSEEWRSLDVNILHSVVLEPMLGIGPAQLAAEKNVEFLRSADETVEHVRGSGPYQVAFLVNPVKLDQIKRIVGKGERFPQKTTDFYPKLLTGLLLCKLNFVG